MAKITPSIFLPAQSVQRCSKCNKYLSVGPVTISSGKPVCGRCPPATECPALFYENLAEYMYFPCTNKRSGCDAMLAWGTVSSHEEKCEFNPVECPALKCNKKIKKDNIKNHFESSHSELITNDGQFYVSVNDEPVNNLLLWEDKIFIWKINATPYHCYFEVSSWDGVDGKRLKYDIFVEGDGEGHLRSVVSVPIDTYLEKHHNVLSMSKVSLHVMKTILHLNAAVFTIRIARESSVNPLLNRNLLSELECPICTNYMKPPVFMCAVGHSICKCCKSNISICPLCQSEMKDNRNYVLEKLTEHISFPCKYENNGCDSVGTLSFINDHEQNCEHKISDKMNCYVNYLSPCTWKGSLSEIVPHLTQCHPMSYVNVNQPIVLNLKQFKVINAFTEYNTDIFKVQVTYHSTEGLNFCVKLVSNKHKQNYRYFLNFRDRNENHRFLSLNRFCTISKPENDTVENGVFIKKQLILSFSKHGKLEVKLNIVEI